MPTIAAKEHCTGCTACESVCPKGCITMKPDQHGFLLPFIDAGRCIACGLCEKICPVMNPPGLRAHLPKAYAAYSKDELMRLHSSSGGIFTEIAKIVLRHGGAVFGAAYNQEFEVVHTCAENEDDLSKLRGAKYAQANLHGVFVGIKQKLDAGQMVLFSGTPCQAAGLTAFLRRDYENLITVDFVCHSVPSPMAWRKYVAYRAEQDNGGQLPTSIDLRSKATGWSRYQYSNLFQYENHADHISKSGDSIYMKLFVGGYINRESCTNCRFKGYSRVSDLTIGDFWGIWDIAPEMDDNKGTSVVLVQSGKGEKILDQIKERCAIQAVSLAEASAQNQAMLHSAQENTRRAEVLQWVQAGDFAKCRDLFTVPKVSFCKRFIRRIRSVLRRLN